MTEYQPRYKWRVTWPDEGDKDSWQTDFCGWDGEIRVGRIRYEPHGPKKDFWQWSGHGGRVGERLTPHQGYVPTAREASRKVEEYYCQLMAHNGMPEGNP